MDRICSLLRVAACVVFASLPATVQAQETGRVIGRIVDAEAGAPIAGAQVEVAGTSIRTVSAIDGRYTLLNVLSGTVAVSARFVGYQPKTVTGLVVPNGGAVEQNISLTASVVQLEEVAVTAAAERGSVNAALDEQKNAVGVINAISAEQISRTPDSDAGQAVQRVSGVSVQDGKYVIVRGLGERYTTTALNGATIPSAEADRKVVPLDLFPTNLLEGITTSKTFTPDQPGDFSGARVDLKTREFPAGRQAQLGVSAGFNTAATGKTIARSPSASGDWFAAGASHRAIPPGLADAGNLAGLSQTEMNSFMSSFRNVWAPVTENGNPNGSFNGSIGGEDPVFGQLVGYLASFSYNNSQEIRADETKGLARLGPTPGTAEPLNQYHGQSSTASVLWGGLLNLSSRIGAGTKLQFNNTYTRAGDNTVEDLGGFNEEFANTFAFSRLQYVQRSIRSNQLVGDHLLGQRDLVNWSVTSAGVTRDEPDRSDIGYLAREENGELVPYQWFGGPRFATRTFSDLTESSWNLNANYRHDFGSADDPFTVKVGGAWRTTSRDVTSRAYDMINFALDNTQLQAPPDQVFSPSNIDASSFLLRANALGGNYTADEDIYAGYVQAEFPLSSRLLFIGGARVENWALDVVATRPDGQVVPATPRKTDVLPSLGLTYRLTTDQNVRFAATQTVSRPEYRELADVDYFEQVGFATTRGNPDLERALIRNLDLRWEWFPRGGEIISLGVFYKNFDSPIEKVYIQSSGANVLSYVNAEKANNFGIELEARKNLDVIARGLRPFTMFANLTLMKSDITPGNDSISALTNSSRPMVGQSPYIVNAGLLWAQGPWSASLLYNVQGKRILEAGTGGIPDAYEQPRHLVDATFQLPVVQNLQLKLEAKNILNAPYRFTQGDVVRQRYQTGTVLGFAFKWDI